MRSPKKDQKKRRRLFWRIFLHGFLLIVVLAIASEITFAAIGVKPNPKGIITRSAEILADEIRENSMGQADLQSQLEKLHHIMEMDLAVYTQDGKSLAKAGAEPPPPLSRKEAGSLTHDHLEHGVAGEYLAIKLPQRTGTAQSYLIVSWPTGDLHSRFIIWLGVILLVISLMSIPLARSIARPLDRLTETARKLSSGDLSARTDLKRKDEFGTLARTMDEMAERLNERLALERELLANVSHEIRTPLARIKVALELCDEKDKTGEDIKPYLLNIAQDAADLERLIEDVLVATRLDLAGRQQDKNGFVLRKEPVDPSVLAENATERFAQGGAAQNLIVHVAPDLPRVSIDPALFTRVLGNLIDNAVKYSPPTSDIELRIWYERPNLVIQVSDRGIGIADADLERIFEPFYRADPARSKDTGGFGLGLTISRRIVESHGGTLWAVPREKGGTAFRITLEVP